MKLFQWFLSKTNNYILDQSFVCTQLNGFKYCYLKLEILTMKNSYLIRIIFTHPCGFKTLIIKIPTKTSNNSVTRVDMNLAATTTSSKSHPWSNIIWGCQPYPLEHHNWSLTINFFSGKLFSIIRERVYILMCIWMTLASNEWQVCLW